MFVALKERYLTVAEGHYHIALTLFFRVPNEICTNRTTGEETWKKTNIINHINKSLYA